MHISKTLKHQRVIFWEIEFLSICGHLNSRISDNMELQFFGFGNIWVENRGKSEVARQQSVVNGNYMTQFKFQVHMPRYEHVSGHQVSSFPWTGKNSTNIIHRVLCAFTCGHVCGAADFSLPFARLAPSRFRQKLFSQGSVFFGLPIKFQVIIALWHESFRRNARHKLM